MKTEYEVRVLEVDVEEMTKKLLELGAEKIGEYEQKRYVYDILPAQEGKWIRLRTNGTKATLTYKDIVSKTIDGTKEVEVTVDDFEATNELLQRSGIVHKNYQENRRIQYSLDGVEIDFDSWPQIPTYMEVEGKSEEEVQSMLEKLEVQKDKITALHTQDIYEKYGICLPKIKELRF